MLGATGLLDASAEVSELERLIALADGASRASASTGRSNESSGGPAKPSCSSLSIATRSTRWCREWRPAPRLPFSMADSIAWRGERRSGVSRRARADPDRDRRCSRRAQPAGPMPVRGAHRAAMVARAAGAARGPRESSWSEACGTRLAARWCIGTREDRCRRACPPLPSHSRRSWRSGVCLGTCHLSIRCQRVWTHRGAPRAVRSGSAGGAGLRRGRADKGPAGGDALSQRRPDTTNGARDSMDPCAPRSRGRRTRCDVPVQRCATSPRRRTDACRGARRPLRRVPLGSPSSWLQWLAAAAANAAAAAAPSAAGLRERAAEREHNLLAEADEAERRARRRWQPSLFDRRAAAVIDAARTVAAERRRTHAERSTSAPTAAPLIKPLLALIVK